MEAELDAIESAMKAWARAKNDADDAEARHKNMTAAQIKVFSENEGVTKAKEFVYGSDQWLERQIEVNKKGALAAYKKAELDQAIRRWETARSEYAATRRVT